MRRASEVTRPEPRPFGWAWLRRLLGQPGWVPPVRPVLDLHLLRRITYL